MSQRATLFRISATDFQVIVQDHLQADARALSKEYITLNSTHEGFRFLLSIGRTASIIELVNQLFYPAESISEIPESQDLGDKVIHYNSPEKVTAMAAFLATIDDTTLKTLYDANELNENDVYPGHWSATTSADIAFNITHLLLEWPLLKGIYTRAAAEGDFIICFVG